MDERLHSSQLVWGESWVNSFHSTFWRTCVFPLLQSRTRVTWRILFHGKDFTPHQFHPWLTPLVCRGLIRSEPHLRWKRSTYLLHFMWSDTSDRREQQRRCSSSSPAENQTLLSAPRVSFVRDEENTIGSVLLAVHHNTKSAHSPEHGSGGGGGCLMSRKANAGNAVSVWIPVEGKATHVWALSLKQAVLFLFLFEWTSHL